MRTYFILVIYLLPVFTLAQYSVRSIEKTLDQAGKAFYDLNGEKSLRLSQKALDQAHKINSDVLMAKAYNLIGLNLEEFYSADKGLKYYKKALVYAQKGQNDSVLIWVNNNLGNYYSYRKNDFN